MKFFEDINLVAQIIQLIRLKATGTPVELSDRLNLSERHVRRIIKDLKEEGVPIKYCKHRRTYFSTKPVFMKFEIFSIEGDEKKKIIGGERKNIEFFKDFFQTDILCPSGLSPLQ